MKISISGSTVRLHGDWSIKGLNRIGISLLTGALHQLKPGVTEPLTIDCQHVTAIDSFGNEVLSGWLQIARFHGHEPHFANLPDQLRNSFTTTNFRSLNN